MTDRDFKLLVREYFAYKGIAESCLTLADSAAKDLPKLEKRILSELEAFTEREQQELPFKD